MWSDLAAHAVSHVELTVTSLAIAIALGSALGVLASVHGATRAIVLALAGTGRTLPSIAVLTLLLPWLGVGSLPAIVALVLLALPPIVINVELGIRSVPRAAMDAATGLGLDAIQRFRRVVVPLALPVAVSGMRTAAVEVVASATLATFIGAGGLGDDIVRALQTSDVPLLIAAGASVAALAFMAEFVFGRLAARVEVSS